jgi:hypothetical protein
MRVNAVAYTWSADKHDVELRDVLNAIRGELQSCGGLAWLSSRLLSETKLCRGHQRVHETVAELVKLGYIRRVSARGRGRGRGRTLYWLPKTGKTKVLAALRREGMPPEAILAAIAFFPRAKNDPLEVRQQSLRSSTFGTEKRKGRPARRARRSRSPDEPHLGIRTVTQDPSTPPSLGRLSKHGWEPALIDAAATVVALLDRGAQRPGRITDDPATHPEGCECSDCSARPSP